MMIDTTQRVLASADDSLGYLSNNQSCRKDLDCGSDFTLSCPKTL